jgi:hypothetical protein
MKNYYGGVEEEYQIIDPETRDLRSHLSKNGWSQDYN